MWGEDFVPVSIRIPGCINVFPLYKVTKSMIQYPFENNFCFTCRSLLVVSIPYPWLNSLICLMQMTFLSFQYIKTKCIAFEICITEHHHHHRLNTVFLKGFLSYSSLGFIIMWVWFGFFFTSERCMNWMMCRCHQCDRYCQKSQGHAGTTHTFLSLGKISSF